MRRTWFFHNAVAHPCVAVLDLTGRALLVASDACRNLADRVHDETCPATFYGAVDNDDITDDDVAEACAWAAEYYDPPTDVVDDPF